MDYWITMRRARAVVVLLAVVAVFSAGASGQNHNTESPYSRYGLGERIPGGSAKSYAMGGIAQGLRNAHIINLENPASYTAQDTLSFIFDIALEGHYAYYSSDSGTKSSGAGSIHHLAIQFPIGKLFGVAAGFQPATQMGYDVTRFETDKRILSEVGRVRYRHLGHGGVSMAFLGFAYEPCRYISVGVNAQYLFGSINRTQEMYVPHHPLYAESSYEQRLVLNGTGISVGVQGIVPLGSVDSLRDLRLGATVETVPFLHGERRYEFSYSYLAMRRYLDQNALAGEGRISVPVRYALGGLYRDLHWETGADVHYQDWSSFEVLGAQDKVLAASYGVAVGVQYTPNPFSQRYYLARMQYRLGGFYEQEPIRLRGVSIRHLGVTFGVGLPYGRSGTMFHFGGRLGLEGTESKGLVQQSYAALVFGMSLNDVWFYKRKYN